MRRIESEDSVDGVEMNEYQNLDSEAVIDPPIFSNRPKMLVQSGGNGFSKLDLFVCAKK
jgi:hypothetical protein